MRVNVTPSVADLQRGTAIPVTITLHNPHEIIAGATVRILGADPAWVEISEPRVSLFPGESRTVTVTLNPPDGLPAGARKITVQVRELTPPHQVSLHEVFLQVPVQEESLLRVDPPLARGGRAVAFGAVVENRGNTVLHATLVGHDEEEKVRFDFHPPKINLAPGENLAVEIRARARRRLLGNPVPRPLTVHLDRRNAEQITAGAALGDPAARATFLQRPWVGRGAMSLGGLLTAVTVFAVVITLAFAGVVKQSAADRDLALQVAAARNADGTSAAGTGRIRGTVRLLTSRSPVSGVAVHLFAADKVGDGDVLASTATDSRGTFMLEGLSTGSYKLRVVGAGFAAMWYPAALAPDQATPLELREGQALAGLIVLLGGLPGSLAGTVEGDDVQGTIVTLTLPDPATTNTDGANGVTSSTRTSTVDSDAAGALVASAPVTDGAFLLESVPSPATFVLTAQKEGYSSTRQLVDLSGGEKRTGLVLHLLRGDGRISGTVTSGGKPLGGATIRATGGVVRPSTGADTVAQTITGTTTATTTTDDPTGPLTAVATTMSLTEGKVGTFVLRSLPTQHALTIVVSRSGYLSQTLSLSLAGQDHEITGLNVELGVATAVLSGTARTQTDRGPAGGVTVSVTDGAMTRVTATSSGRNIGRWQIGGLPVPGTYSVTFERSDLAPEILAVGLDAAGRLTSVSTVTSTDAVDAYLSTATVSLQGTVTQMTVGSSSVHPSPDAVVQVSDGTTTWKVPTASTPSQDVGSYKIEGLPPGTYTVTATRSGTRPASEHVTLRTGREEAVVNIRLLPGARIHGVVTVNGIPPITALVALYRWDGYYKTPVGDIRTDANGAYLFEDIEAAQRYIVEVQLPAGSPSATRLVVVEPSQDAEVDFHLPEDA